MRNLVWIAAVALAAIALASLVALSGVSFPLLGDAICTAPPGSSNDLPGMSAWSCD